MFNGWPATHADILAGLTFDRSIAADVVKYFKEDNSLVAMILGASGVGKNDGGPAGFAAIATRKLFVLGAQDRPAIACRTMGKSSE